MKTSTWESRLINDRKWEGRLTVRLTNDLLVWKRSQNNSNLWYRSTSNTSRPGGGYKGCIWKLKIKIWYRHPTDVKMIRTSSWARDKDDTNTRTSQNPTNSFFESCECLHSGDTHTSLQRKQVTVEMHKLVGTNQKPTIPKTQQGHCRVVILTTNHSSPLVAHGNGHCPPCLFHCPPWRHLLFLLPLSPGC